jgi:hypothetical protein
MNHQSPPQLRRYFSFLACAGLLCATSVHAKRVAMTDNEMSEVHAQGLFILENSNYGGLDFSKIALDADVDLSANFRNMLLGTNATAGTSDIHISDLQFGRSDGGEANRLVKISNPYIQFVYNKPVDAPTQVVGIRIGFDGISGDVGFLGKVISGSMYVDGSATAVNGILDATGKQWTGSNAPCIATATCGTTKYLNLADLGAITAGNASGPSRDFWISALMQPVQFKAPEGSGLPDPAVAQAGYWLNWRDKLIALSAQLPSNKAPGR